MQGSRLLRLCHHLRAAVTYRCQLWVLCWHRRGNLSLPIYKALVTLSCRLLYLHFRPGLLLWTITCPGTVKGMT